jgi:hypothetical protein
VGGSIITRFCAVRLQIRDHLLCAVYGTLSTVKKRFPTAAEKIELTRVGYIAARGESRRLTGDYVLTENDIRSQMEFSDGVARGGLVFCLHYPGQKHDFRSELKLTAVKPLLGLARLYFLVPL